MKTIWNLPKIEIKPFSEIQEKRRVALVTSLPAWEAVKSQLTEFPPASISFVQEATLAHWNKLSVGLYASAPEVVYAVGGGLTADAGKYFASLFHLPMVCLPTALSVDAFFTAAAGIRENGCVEYIETPPPDQVVIDFDVLAAAPESIRAAGITDVLSIATGSWDWKFAHERKKNPPEMEFIPWVYENAQSILHAALDCAESAGRGEPDGLKQLLDCLCMEVQLCNQIGHARPEEGSEHYFAYCAEQFTGPGWPHADLLGPGILHMAERQGQDPGPLRKAMEVCCIPLGRVTSEVTVNTLEKLPEYCREHGLPYGLAHELKEKK
jgi:glycerol-1-phosphate dehydrogenase [NAD(P)+]